MQFFEGPNPGSGSQIGGPGGGAAFPGSMQAGLSDLAGMAIGFPWSGCPRGKPRRGMMRRAVFSDLQRRGLEKRFQHQKYISKPDRKKLAEKLGLKDSQVSSNVLYSFLIIYNINMNINIIYYFFSTKTKFKIWYCNSAILNERTRLGLAVS